MKLNFYSFSVMLAYRKYRVALHSRSMFTCRKAIEELNFLCGVISSAVAFTSAERIRYINYINELNDKAFDLFIELANSNE